MSYWKLARSNWRKFARLSRRERRVLVQALFLLPSVALALRLLGFNRCRSTLARLAPLDRTPPMCEDEARFSQARSTARMAKAAARHGLYRANCLQQSMTLWWLLRRQLINSELRIGVRREASRFEAHAWVEFGGVILNDTDDVNERFMPFDRVIAPAEARVR